MAQKTILPVRHLVRLSEFDYSSEGSYFLTVCAIQHKCIFSRIVGGVVLEAPFFILSSIGRIVERNLLEVLKQRTNIVIDRYVIMPNHVHILLRINGASGTPPPTNLPVNRAANAVIPAFVGTWKRFANREAGRALFQRSYYDHVIRNEKDFLVHWEYIENNPARWLEDALYREETEDSDVCR